MANVIYVTSRNENANSCHKRVVYLAQWRPAARCVEIAPSGHLNGIRPRADGRYTEVMTDLLSIAVNYGTEATGSVC